MTGVWYLLALISVTAASEWGYLNHGPSTWARHYRGCGGKSQSPINIGTNSTVKGDNLGAFRFRGYDETPRGARFKLVNNGHSAQVNFDADDEDAYSISGGGLRETYIADQFHFHWGSNNDKGSEHTVDGKSYPMEMHIVHHSDEFDSLKEAMVKSRGLAVLGFFFEIGNENPVFSKLVQKLRYVPIPDDKTSVTPFVLKDLLPTDLDNYWRYSGSLTTPTCDQTVVWTIFQKPITISQKQLDAFRRLYYDARPLVHLADNFRPTQPLNGRKVYHSTPTSNTVLRLLRYLKNLY